MALSVNVFFASIVLALPQGASVESGSATISQPNATTLKISAANNTIINFSSFNIAPNETVAITLPSDSSRLLARDLGPNESQILGSLTANGTLVLTNPNGIYFGPSANVQVNNLIASTLDIASNDFLNGNLAFSHTANAPYGQVSNEGTIKAQNLVLQGSSVNNSGLIQATVGTVHLVSGDKTTVSFDPQGDIKVAVNAQTMGKMAGVTTAVSNSGTIQAHQVVMTAQTAQDVFEDVINQTGVVQATQMVNDNGVIKIVGNGNVQVSGSVQAPGGTITMSSTERSLRMDQALAAAAQQVAISAAQDVKVNAPVTVAAQTTTITAGASVTVNAPVTTQGNTTISAKNNITVNANITTDSGNLSLLADSDLDGQGSLLQAPGTTIKTTTFGDITLQGAGNSMVGNVQSAGNIILKPSTTAVVLTQQSNSVVMAALSLIINKGTTLNAANATIVVGKDWQNNGNFVAQNSNVVLTSPQTAQVIGNNTFNNFIIDPNIDLVNFQTGNLSLFDQNGNYSPVENQTSVSKAVNFGAGATQAVTGSLIVQGKFGLLVNLNSTIQGVPWLLNILGKYSIDYASLANTTNVNTTGPPVAVFHTQNLLGNTGFSFANVQWIGTGNTSNWSESDNWDGGFVPGVGDVVELNGSGNSAIDPAFPGTVAGLKIDTSYAGTLTFERSLSLVGLSPSVIAGHLSSAQAIIVTSVGDLDFEGATVLQAPVISFSSLNNIAIDAPVTATGNTTFAADNNIYVNADVTVNNGNLIFLADADLNGVGAFIQAPGTTISTVGSGDVTIQGSGQNYIGNIQSAGNLTLKQGGEP
ncbi:MAG: filamentous hemagglutinin N-terminal domain-containing protein, partial [Candidatus Omnitrophica bacterium]|nr:filamentous hemagglutinin N-terminal domain-containing protein [Candidatus Omnitrophota bacterium]